MFAQAAAWGNPKKLAELLGPEAKPELPMETKSLNLPDAGLAILRAGEGPQQTCVFFDYGQHGGGHGHYDKLSITLFANGREWLLDTGRIGYSFKEYKTWVKHTVAHNTVVVNEADQFPTAGKLTWMQSGKDWSACAGECSSAYAGVTLRRRLCLTPKLLIDMYDVETKEPSQIDWLAHAVTEPVVPAEGERESHPAEIGRGEGYPHLREGQRWGAFKTSRWDFPAGKQRLRLWLEGDAEDELLTAVGIGRHVNEKAPALIRRRKDARAARFVTVYDVTGEGQYVRRLEPEKADLPVVAVETTTGTVRFRFLEDGLEID